MEKIGIKLNIQECFKFWYLKRYPETRVAETSHFDGSGSPKNWMLRLRPEKKYQFCSVSKNWKFLRIFVCNILGQSWSRMCRSGSASRLRPGKKGLWLRLRNPAGNSIYWNIRITLVFKNSSQARGGAGAHFEICLEPESEPKNKKWTGSGRLKKTYVNFYRYLFSCLCSCIWHFFFAHNQGCWAGARV